MKYGLAGIALIAVVASAGCTQRFKSENQYVAFCSDTLAKEGVDKTQSKVACGCMYRQARASAEKQGTTEIGLAEFKVYFDRCMKPVVASSEAKAAWDIESADASGYGDRGWGSDGSDGYASDWGD